MPEQIDAHVKTMLAILTPEQILLGQVPSVGSRLPFSRPALCIPKVRTTHPAFPAEYAER